MTSKALDDWLALDDVADLNNCDREPVHAPSAIQSHGALVVLDTDGNPIQASDNFQQVIERYGGLEALKERLKQPDFARLDPAVPRLATWRVGQETCAVVHSRSDTLTIVELEPADSERSPDVLAVVSEAIDAIENATLEQAFETLCNAIREITGFHRVMAYHMAPDGHGVVVAESTADPEPRFLGLHFPATDIPKQARRLYVLERTRIIADVHAEPIPIRPVINPKTGRPLN
ncbi:MAG: hypothetical protein AB8H79_19985, partial [Myxococcota bacterium]